MRQRARQLLAAAVALSLLAAAPSCRRRQPIPSRPLQPKKRESPAPSLKIIYPGAPGSFVKLAKELARVVVHVSADSAVRGGPADWFAAATTPQSPTEIAWAAGLQRALGSALLVDRQGHLLTNAHLVGERQRVQATLPNSQRAVTASVLGRDARTDLALLKIDPKGLPARFKPARLGKSERLQPGEWLVLLSDPFGLGYRVTAGVVSAIPRREIPMAKHSLWGFIQTDIAIHPGNSGGPVFNTVGEVIGIATSVKEEPQGIGFVVPIDVALRVMPMLRKHGKVVRSWVGIRIAPVSAELAAKVGLKKPRGALVTEVFPRSPADRSGLRRGDIVLRFDKRDVSDARQLPWLATLAGVGKVVIVKVWRGGKELTFTLRGEAMPE